MTPERYEQLRAMFADTVIDQDTGRLLWLDRGDGTRADKTKAWQDGDGVWHLPTVRVRYAICEAVVKMMHPVTARAPIRWIEVDGHVIYAFPMDCRGGFISDCMVGKPAPSGDNVRRLG